ncbi:hypothetical protein DTO195F2_1595 [Paecilomyces variotii]|nr:hypothetical protein DTO195F2_1595 [Paecilomyces variotii]KAJ9374113.1 hypothetical protein DTO282E5_1035 [Paecilomyces variotii]
MPDDNFDPDSPLLGSTERIVQLSERDVAAQIPINFVTHPTVSLAAACFGNGVYEDQAAKDCISNLLAVGYRRLIVDLYWSTDRSQWTFCPVAIPLNVAGATMVSASTMASAPAATLTSGNMDGSTTTASSTASTTSAAILEDVSETSASQERRCDPSVSTTDAYTAQTTVSSTTDSSGSRLYKLGPYSCTQTLGLQTMVDLFYEYFRDTENTLDAYPLYVIFNIHAPSVADAPESPAPSISGSKLPASSQLIGSIMDDTLGTYVYSPPELYHDRADLNRTWFSVVIDDQPITEYFTLKKNRGGFYSSPDGWPCENYLQGVKAKRLLLGWGSVDPQMQGYNFTGDASRIFPQNYLTSGIQTTSTGDRLQSGCLYNPNTISVAQVNSSWAGSNQLTVPSLENEKFSLGNLTLLVQNLTACGISPTLNTTLFDKTANTQVDTYRNVSLSTTWSWAVGEPRNASSSGGDDDDNSGTYDRCAIMDVTLAGHWRAADCAAERHVACRVGNAPYNWTLTDNKVPYTSATDACSDQDASFSVPRTGLENTYLYYYLISQRKDAINPSSDDADKREVWLNFNSLDVNSCWVTGGPNVSCPYTVNSNELERRTVLVPTIAGVVVLVITALTLFVKCNANRRNSRRKKRVIEGWEYEGVPS